MRLEHLTFNFELWLHCHRHKMREEHSLAVYFEIWKQDHLGRPSIAQWKSQIHFQINTYFGSRLKFTFHVECSVHLLFCNGSVHFEFCNAQNKKFFIRLYSAIKSKSCQLCKRLFIVRIVKMTIHLSFSMTVQSRRTVLHAWKWWVDIGR